MRDYELTFIGRPDLDPVNMTALIEKVSGYVTAEGGIIKRVDAWGMRRLTYPIKKLREGQYVFMPIQLEGSSVARVEQRLKLVEDCIRYLLVSAEEDAAPAPAVVADAPAAEPVAAA